MRNKYRIGAFVVMSLFVLIPLNRAIADPVSEPESSRPGSVTETQTESTDASPREKSGERDTKATPADPFIPSESISADSAISFPVDI